MAKQQLTKRQRLGTVTVKEVRKALVGLKPDMAVFGEKRDGRLVYLSGVRVFRWRHNEDGTYWTTSQLKDIDVPRSEFARLKTPVVVIYLDNYLDGTPL